jgi:predicted Rossmann fold nucleotide-binding protein DprA/Smf involved in DNA uptake
VEGVEDILEEFEYLFPPRRMRQESADRPPVAVSNNVRSEDPREQQLIEVLAGSGPKVIDDITAASGLDPGETAGLLFRLQLKKLVRQFPGQRYGLSVPEESTD